MAHSWPKRRLGRLAQPCGARLDSESKSAANEAVQRSLWSSVVVPDSACHAGGRGFESRHSRKVPANKHIVLSVQTPNRRRLPRPSSEAGRKRSKAARNGSRGHHFKAVRAEIRPDARRACDYTKRPEVKAAAPGNVSALRITAPRRLCRRDPRARCVQLRCAAASSRNGRLPSRTNLTRTAPKRPK